MSRWIDRRKCRLTPYFARVVCVSKLVMPNLDLSPHGAISHSHDLLECACCIARVWERAYSGIYNG